MKVKFNRENEFIIAPYQATSGSAGFDLYASKVTRKGLFLYEYETGISIELPVGYEAQLRPRSSVYKTGMILANSVGTIDSDYRGTIKAMFWKIPFIGKKYEVGDRIGQIVINKIPKVLLEEVMILGSTERNKGGFGEYWQMIYKGFDQVLNYCHFSAVTETKIGNSYFLPQP